MENQFERYLKKCVRRERRRIVFSTFTWIVLSLIAITAVAMYACYVFGYLDKIVVAARGMLVLIPLGLIFALWWLPSRALKKDRGVSLLSRRDARFQNRVDTYLELKKSQPESGFISLLAEDNFKIAKTVPPNSVVPGTRFGVSFLILLGCLTSVAVFNENAGPALQKGVMHIWAGWRVPDLIEPRNIAVSPGDDAVLYGRNLDIKAEVSGFKPQSLTLHVQIGAGEWQQTELNSDELEQFSMTLFRITEPVSYYVSSGLTKSDQHIVEVVQAASLESLSATLRYPEWTELTARELTPVKTLRGVAGTEITLRLVTDKALVAGSLKLENQSIAVSRDTTAKDEFAYTVDLTLQERDSAVISDTLLGEEIDLSDIIPIRIEIDKAPEISFIRPAKDVNASPIEEVTIALEAEDDFAIEELVLMYSVNAGEWQSIVATRG